MEKCKVKHLEIDTCLFFRYKVICIVYVDDLLFWEKDEVAITQVVLRLRNKELISINRMMLLDSLESN